MLGIPNPVGGLASLLETLRVLPEIAQNTAAMAQATRSLPDIERKLADIERAVIEMDGRMAAIEATMPVLTGHLDSVSRLVNRVPGARRRG